MEEGAHEVKVKIKDGLDGVAAASTVASHTVSSQVTGEKAVVTRTLKPLVKCLKGVLDG